MSTVLQPAGASNCRRIWRNAGAVLGAGIVGFVTLVAIFAPLLAPYDPFTIDLGRRVIPPMWMEGGTPTNILGTDQLGRDYLSRLIYGARVSMIIGVATIITSGIIGTVLGVMGGFYGGRVDDAVVFAITARLSIPVVLVALAVAGLLGTSFTLVILVLGLLLWDRFAVVATLEMALAILLEAALSFLGLGVPPPLPSWGLMISEAKEYMFFSPWIIMIPGIALFILVLGVNLLGDALRDMLGTDLSR
ncbi:MAG: ABC transporter permease [Alphaproteobacteria bacterium]